MRVASGEAGVAGESSALITVTANGRNLVMPGSSSIDDLLSRLEQHPRAVAVEHNRRIIKRADYGTTVLSDGDRLEIVRFVQGG